MSIPTRQEIIDAHTALENLSDLAFIGADSVNKEALANIWKDEIKRVVPPKPQPTMAEVEWDDEKHCMAEAEHADWGTMTMLKPMRTYPQIKCLSTKGGDYCILYPSPEDLILTGRRYTLTEVQE